MENFGVVALSTHSDQTLVKFELLNIHTNCSTRWISVITGDMIEELTEQAKVLVNLKKARLDLFHLKKLDTKQPCII